MTNYLLLLGVGLIWGSQFLLNELAIAVFAPTVVAAGRTVIGFLTLAVLVALTPHGRAPSPVQGSSAELWRSGMPPHGA